MEATNTHKDFFHPIHQYKNPNNIKKSFKSYIFIFQYAQTVCSFMSAAMGNDLAEDIYVARETGHNSNFS